MTKSDTIDLGFHSIYSSSKSGRGGICNNSASPSPSLKGTLSSTPKLHKILGSNSAISIFNDKESYT